MTTSVAAIPAHMPAESAATGIDLDASPYQGYLYSYPHKLAYREIDPPARLRDIWAGERRDSLFFYAHIPFCEMRCGFCNLFTRTTPPAAQVTAFLDALRRQASAVRGELDAAGGARFAGAALGGGTPTYLTADELEELVGICEIVAPEFRQLAASVETSPATATPDRLAVLEAAGTGRISMGVQSFIDAETHAAGRPQRRATVNAAIELLLGSSIGCVNLDLIYGIPGQTLETWAESLRTLLDYRPAEAYLYPLYIRRATGLGRRQGAAAPPDELRLEMYRLGRDMVSAAGYEQVSMRQFRLPTAQAPDLEFSCQRDGTIGLGCGARSYTRGLHYSFDYAVAVPEVRRIIDDYCAESDFRYARHGFRLDAAEQARRWLIVSLLTTTGLSLDDFRNAFGSGAVDSVATVVAPLVERGWAIADSKRVQLTAAGLERSDVIGPWLISAPVRRAMAERELR